MRNQRILLYYTIYEDAVVTRFAKWINDGTEPIEICRFLSMNMDLPTQEYDVLTLSGAHTEEKNVYRRPLCADSVTIESSRGTSSPQATPFIGLLSPGLRKSKGSAWSKPDLQWKLLWMCSVDSMEQSGTAWN